MLGLLLALFASLPHDAGPLRSTSSSFDSLPGGPAALERIEVLTQDPGAVIRLTEELGGKTELVSHERVQVLIPRTARATLLSHAAVEHEVAPTLSVPLQASAGSKGLLGADRWREAGFTGRGVKVAVLDGGFRGYTGLLGRTLPTTVTAKSFRAGAEVDAGTDHGTLAAEVVSSIAPGARLYLVSFGTTTELSAAVDFLLEEQVDVVSFSLGFLHSGPGDGSGPVNEIISRGAQAGATWVVASGNWARQHWRGPYTDTNGDSIHEFASDVTEDGRQYQRGDLISVSLRWDEAWGHACSDFDLELFAPSGTLVRASRRSQQCGGDPVEGFQVLATETGTYSARVIGSDVRAPHVLDLLMVGAPDRGDELNFATPLSSLAEPADNPSVLTVGALGAANPLAAAPFSSRGPTIDGRPKPELLSPTGGLAPGASSFAGTSAAAPHVAGIAALLREAIPSADAARVTAILKERAISLGRTTPGAPELLASLGSPAAFGPLLPPGATQSRFVGGTPQSGDLALLVYLGPSGYPARFGHLLSTERAPQAYFRFDQASQAFGRYIVGAPDRVQTFTLFESGQPYVVRFGEP